MAGPSKRTSRDPRRAVAGEPGDAVDTRGLDGLGQATGEPRPSDRRGSVCFSTLAARVTLGMGLPPPPYSCFWIVNSKYRGVKFTTESAEGWLIMDS
jgi:hypothetical protein